MVEMDYRKRKFTDLPISDGEDITILRLIRDLPTDGFTSIAVA